jgi:hypothetical protein
MSISPQKLHKWRLRGILVDEIKAVYEEIPVAARGGYYAWFLENTWILDASLRPPITATSHVDMIRAQAWQFIHGPGNVTSASIRLQVATWPAGRAECFQLYTIILDNGRPPPGMPIWVNFGFCACNSEFAEGPLWKLYRDLMDNCTFDEFCSAYETCALVFLLDGKGGGDWRQQFPDLEDVLQRSPRGHKSVWWLKDYVLAEDAALHRSVSVDYGFMNCKTDDEVEQLKQVYRKILGEYGAAKPLLLHEAAITGQLYAYIGGLMKLEGKKKFKRLLKNIYPLRSVTETTEM